MGLHQVTLLQLQAPSVGVGIAKAVNAAKMTACVIICQHTGGCATREKRCMTTGCCKRRTPGPDEAQETRPWANAASMDTAGSCS